MPFLSVPRRFFSGRRAIPVLLGLIRHPWAAKWCAAAPLAALAHFALAGFDPRLELADKGLLVVVSLAALAYSRRVVAVARARSQLPE